MQEGLKSSVVYGLDLILDLVAVFIDFVRVSEFKSRF